MKLDHIAIAVSSLEDAVRTYESLGLRVDDIVTIESQKVRVAILQVGESCIELLEPTATNSVIQRFLETKKPGVHHLCFKVKNLDEKLSELKLANVEVLEQVPCRGYQDRRVAFLHPKTTHGVLIELVEET